MDASERLFGWLYGWLRTRPQPPSEYAVFLEPHRGHLALFASALASTTVALRDGQGVGGVRTGTIFLPACVDLHDSPHLNLEVYLFRIAYSVGLLRLGLPESLPGNALARSIATLLLIPRVLHVLSPDAPALGELLSRVRAFGVSSETQSNSGFFFWYNFIEALFGDGPLPEDPAIRRVLVWAKETRAPDAELVDHADLISRRLVSASRDVRLWCEQHFVLTGRLLETMRIGAQETLPLKSTSEAPPSATERTAPARDEVRLVDVTSPEDENPLVHSFEKVHTLDDYHAGSKRIDGEDNLQKQLDALQELDLSAVVRTSQTADSVYRMDGLFSDFASDSADETDGTRKGRLYDEWDEHRGQYRRAFCNLLNDAPPAPRPFDEVRARLGVLRGEHRTQLQQLKNLVEALRTTTRWKTRQVEGSELDLESWVDRHGTRMAGIAASERLYMARKRNAPEISTLLLLDISLSADAYVSDRRVLDISRDAIALLSDVLGPGNNDFAIAGFHSHTRRDCRWMSIKDFEEPWGLGVARLLAVKAKGYTRMGPALRHGIQVLRARGSARSLLLLISDGRPTDYDRYEGRHGIADVRQAFREAEVEGIFPFALTVARKRDVDFVRLFGQGHVSTIDSPSGLVGGLTEAYQRVSR